MNVGGSSAYVDGHDLSQAVVQKLRALHYRSRCGDDGSVDHVSHVLHPGRLGDVVLEGRLYDLSAGFHIKLVYLGVNVVHQVEFLAALLIEDQLHLLLVLYVSGIYDGDVKPHGAYHLSVVYGRVSFSVIHASCDQDQVGLDLFDLLEVSAS